MVAMGSEGQVEEMVREAHREMTMSNEIRELDDADLEVVAGGFGGSLIRAALDNANSGNVEAPKESVTFAYGKIAFRDVVSS